LTNILSVYAKCKYSNTPAEEHKEYEILQRNARMKNDVCEIVTKWKREHNVWQKWIKKRGRNKFIGCNRRNNSGFSEQFRILIPRTSYKRREDTINVSLGKYTV